MQSRLNKLSVYNLFFFFAIFPHSPVVIIGSGNQQRSCHVDLANRQTMYREIGYLVSLQIFIRGDLDK